MNDCRLFGFVLALAGLVGCSSHPIENPHCSRIMFRQCLGVDAPRCDAMFTQAKTTCTQKLQENSMFDNMPESMKEGYLMRCVADDLVVQSGRPVEEAKNCLRW
jgi:hypothetical protein